MRATLAEGGSAKLFAGTVEVPVSALRDIRLLPLNAGESKNHPFGGHPVAGGTKEITCLSCHLPHAANGSARLFVTEDSRSTTLCVKCH
jgi:predicted CXXCH cytochrome family protein